MFHSMPPVVKVLLPLAIIVILWLRFRRVPHAPAIFGLKSPAVVPMLFWVLLTVVYVYGSDRLIGWRGPWDWAPWQKASLAVDAMRVLGVVVLGPIGEELICRGFLQFRLSKYVHPVAAVAIIALGWAALHVDYSLAVRGVIFGFGLLLGAARLNTASIFVPIAMHIVWNSYAIW